MSINVAAIPSPFIHATIKRRKNTWYTIASGNWSDPNIWMSNSRRRYSSPQTGDDVSIGLGHTVTFDTAVSSITSINNFYVAGTFQLNGNASRQLRISGDVQATGAINLTSAGTFTMVLFGVNNYITSFTSGTASTILYGRLGDQLIMDIPYRHLSVENYGTKYLTNNLNLVGNLIVGSNTVTPVGLTGSNNAVLELSIFDLTVNGTTSTPFNASPAIISKTGSGNVTFIGQVTQNGIISFTGNPSVELRGGIISSNLTSTMFISGSNQWRFTTNNQAIDAGGANYRIFSCPVSIENGITLTNQGTSLIELNQPINATLSGSAFINKATVYFNSTSSLPSFTTGTFDRTSFANTVGYTMGASITLPYTSYSSLLVSNSGTKTSLGNTTLSGNLSVSNTIAGNAVYELSTFDLSVTGTTSVSGTCKLSKNGAGNVLFVGNLGWVNAGSIVDFSAGNPSVECRGGITQTNGDANALRTGAGQWKFSTNNQTITTAGSANYIIFSGNILISGAINVTVTRGGAVDYVVYVNTVNGDNAASTFTIGANGQVYLLTSTLPMATGVFSYNSVSTATLGFAFSGDYTIPYTSFGGLAIGNATANSTGTKTLSGNTTVAGNLLVTNLSGTSSANILEVSTFDLTVSGTTTVAYQISKTGAGSVVLVGLFTLSTNTIATPDLAVNFTGGASLELRGGFTGNSGITSNGTLSFTTNNQTVTSLGLTSFSINCPITISGAITVTNALSGSNVFIIKNTLNGNNALSTFDNRGTVQYQATQQPMLTGVLQTNLAANTFLYNAAGNQDVKGTTYRTLTLAGSGVKTLQGNVVVATAYTLTPPATLALNGFTRA